MTLLSFPGHRFDAAFPPLCQDRIASSSQAVPVAASVYLHPPRPLYCCVSKEKGTPAQKTTSFSEPGKDVTLQAAPMSDPWSCFVTAWTKAPGKGTLQGDGPFRFVPHCGPIWEMVLPVSADAAPAPASCWEMEHGMASGALAAASPSSP